MGTKLSRVREEEQLLISVACFEGSSGGPSVSPSSEVTHKTTACSAIAAFHVGSGEVLAGRIPGEEGPVVLSCPHGSCPVRELPSSGLPWPTFWPYSRASGSLGSSCPFALPLEHDAHPGAFIWFTLLPLWVLPSFSHLGVWHLPRSWTQSAYAFVV